MVAGCLSTALGVAVFGFGGVYHPVRAVAQVAVAVGLVAVAALDEEGRRPLGPAVRWAAAGLLVGVAVCAGLVPLPAALRGVVAPGDARLGWAPASTVPEGTLTFLTYAGWLAAVGMLTSVAALRSPRRRIAEWALVGLVAAVLGVGLVHWVGGGRLLFGVFPTPPDSRRFAAPFIDPSHYGSFLLLGLPTFLMAASDPQRAASARVLAGGLALPTVYMLTQVGSSTPAALAFLQVLLVSAHRTRSAWTFVALGPAFAVASVAWDLRRHDLEQTLSGHDRFAAWQSALALWTDHWLFGAGAGTFLRAIEPYRTDHEFSVWHHAHNDWLEGFVETGLVGLPFWLAAAWVLRPWLARASDRAFAFGLGVCGVLLHAFLEFPLQIPGIAGTAVALWAARLALYGPRAPTRPWLVRGLALGFAVLNALGAAWSWRTGQVEAAATLLADDRMSASAQATLGRLAPWSPLLDVSEAWHAEASGDRARAAALARAALVEHPMDADLFRRSAGVLARTGHVDEALAAADRSVTLGPADWRNWVMRAQVVEGTGDRDAAVAAWKDALAGGAPGKYWARAWTVLPVGVVWVDAVDGLDSHYRVGMSQFLAKQGDLESAKLLLLQAMAEDPGWYPAYLDLLLAERRIDEAASYAEAALASKGDDPQIRGRLAQVRELQGRWSDAAQLWEALATAPKPDRAAAKRAVVVREKADGPEAAMATLRRLRSSRGGSAFVLVDEEAHLQKVTGHPEECVRVYVESQVAQDKGIGAVRKQMEACRTPPLAAPTAPTPVAPTPAAPAPP